VDVTLEIDVAAFGAAGEALLEGVRRGVDAGIREGAEEARRVHRWQNRTGVLQDSIHGLAPTNTSNGAEGILAALAPYASYLEEGTKAHEIKARRAPFLHWEDEEGHHYAKRVWHPGTQASPFIGPAVLKFERVVEREVELGIKRADDILSK
jgi:hypothetical protein